MKNPDFSPSAACRFLRLARRGPALLAVGALVANVIADEAPRSSADAARLVPMEYRHRMIQQLSLADAAAPAWIDAVARVQPEHREALAFLLANMPADDLKALPPERLLAEIELAYQARQATPWARQVPDEIFLNDVLPYASTSELRDPWRADFHSRFAPLVKDCKTATDVVEMLNRDIFKTLNVAYHATRRKKPDQSPKESIEIGYASCTGLSILLVDACRAVGVPARIVGTPLWSDNSGNHTWVEFWDGQWFFIGAAEPGPVNDTWFKAQAARADADKPQYSIYASSFRRTDTAFPAIWARGRGNLYAENVTARYTGSAAPAATQPAVTTSLSKADAELVRQLLWDKRVAALGQERADEWAAQAIVVGDKTMKFATKTFGERPKEGWDLYISLHGGGNTRPEVNDQQWRNQQLLYEPENSLYIAPRAPTNTWNLWHEPHIDIMLDRLIEDAVVLGGANPDRVYLMGYSAGGDGVYQLAPRMADRFAAAAMMAGHPNDASPLGLRNLPFTIHVGALDAGYQRNTVAREWGDRLDALHKADSDGYIHDVTLHQGMGHWMKRADRVALDWMKKFTRDPLPARVVWNQGPTPHDRFYWLAVPLEKARKDQLIDVSHEGQTIRINQARNIDTVHILLNDDMLDLDRPIKVVRGDTVLFQGLVPRTIDGLKQSIDARLDRGGVFSACVKLQLEP